MRLWFSRDPLSRSFYLVGEANLSVLELKRFLSCIEPKLALFNVQSEFPTESARELARFNAGLRTDLLLAMRGCGLKTCFFSSTMTVLSSQAGLLSGEGEAT